MKKIVIADFDELNNNNVKLGNSHYAECFDDDNYEVLWVSSPWNLMKYFQNRQLFYNKKEISTAGRHLVKNNIYAFAPCTKKLYGNYLFAKDAKRVIYGDEYVKPNICETLKNMDFLDVDILWISNLKLYWLSNVIKYKKLVYRMPDDVSEFKIYPDSILEIENKLLEKADVIFVTSKKLLEKVNKRGKNAYWLPNGTNFDHFQRYDAKPKEYESISNPIVVYVGAVGYWFDENIVEHIAKNLKVDIFIIGSCTKDISKLKTLKNIHILGPRSYDIIPNYLHHSDIAIIPFEKSEFSDAINPIKLFEYCSAGIPVVSTDMKEISNLNAPVYAAKNKEDFLKGIKKYLNKEYNKDELIKFGRENSWNNRYEFIKGVLRT